MTGFLGILAQTTQPAINGLDVLEKVTHYFWYAWLILLATGAIVGVVVGWLIPTWISRQQQRNFKTKEEQLLTEIEYAKTDAKTYADIARAETKALTKAVGKALSSTRSSLGDLFVLVGSAGGYGGISAYGRATTDIMGITFYLESDEFSKAEAQLSICLDRLKGSKAELAEMSKEGLDDLGGRLRDLEKRSAKVPNKGNMRKLIEDCRNVLGIG